ncbi:CAP domain-containing protein [Halobacillus litoralis]|uniref:CAP domain-containing protein n=1 Tax=Halobacillus litoralis TaxID=45668 RepID=UPI001CD22092|nr:CAP domain-containing protein [Halobacillus litoralis]MCA0971932.1 CAP domain-containing protein [Halobacillus litoralis]
MMRVFVLPFLLIVASLLSPSIEAGAEGSQHLSNLPSDQTETLQQHSLERVNVYREQLGLPLFRSHDSLKKMAENHAGYLEQYPDDGHFEQQTESEFFTGYSMKHRADHVDYTGVVGEGITYHEESALTSINHLFDAPYHRLSLLDPRFQFIGTAQNASGDFVANYGGEGVLQEPRTVVYPAPDQEQVKVSWFANESPNPLRFFDENRIWTGYPISYRHFGFPNDELIVESAELLDEEGEQVETYNVTPSIEDHGDRHLFLIPKKKLQPGQNYRVEIKAEVKHADGTRNDVSKSWEFSTAGQLMLEHMYLKDERQTTFLKTEWASGQDPNALISLRQSGKTLLEKQGNQQYTYQKLEPGTYQMEIDSPWFNETQKYRVVIGEEEGLLQIESFQRVETAAAASVDSSSYDEMAGIKEVDPDKLWTITFNDTMKESPGFIYVVREDGSKVDVKVEEGSESHTFLVHPPESGYTNGRYQLMIDPMQSNAGQQMTTGVKMNFFVN